MWSSRGIGDYRGSSADVEFQNENLCCTVDGDIMATTPDLICLVDTETFTPVPTDALKYGKRVMVVGLECFDMWRTPAGIDLVGPRYFGIDADYVPVEERVFAEGGVKLMYKLGIDVGGTNTDAVLIDEDLNIVAAVKTPRQMIYTAASWEPWRQF